jgi:hypothetical protein
VIKVTRKCPPRSRRIRWYALAFVLEEDIALVNTFSGIIFFENGYNTFLVKAVPLSQGALEKVVEPVDRL